jgi:hypothetical protein
MLGPLVASAAVSAALGAGTPAPAAPNAPAPEKRVLRLVLQELPQRSFLMHPNDLILANDTRGDSQRG